MSGKIIQLDPAECIEDPLLERISNVPRMAALLRGQADWKEEASQNAADLEAFIADVKARGVIQPAMFYRNAKGQPVLVCGRTRRHAAQATGHKLPAIEIEQKHARDYILSDAAHRRSLPKSAIAYIALLMHPEVAAGSHGGDRKSSSPPNLIGHPTEDLSGEPLKLTFRDLASLAGCSVSVIAEAVETYRYLSTRKKARSKMEPLITAGLITLGAARAGAAGSEATSDQPRRPAGESALVRGLKTLGSRARDFDKWPEDEIEAATASLSAAVATWPESFRAVMRTALTTSGFPKE